MINPNVFYELAVRHFDCEKAMYSDENRRSRNSI